MKLLAWCSPRGEIFATAIETDMVPYCNNLKTTFESLKAGKTAKVADPELRQLNEDFSKALAAYDERAKSNFNHKAASSGSSKKAKAKPNVKGGAVPAAPAP